VAGDWPLLSLSAGGLHIAYAGCLQLPQPHCS